MIDTVAYTQLYKLINPALQGLVTIHRPSDLRIFCKQGYVSWIEVSLPRLLFKTNGKLITRQAEIDRALAKADTEIQKIALPVNSTKTFTRVDLVWHFLGNPRDFYLAHQHCHIQRIERVSLHRNFHRLTGITWGGKGALMTINMYDKNPKDATPQKVVRVEIQLHGAKLRSVLNSQFVTRLDFNKCYQTYRKILLGFKPKSIPQINSKDEVLILAQRKGIPVLKLLSGTMSSKSLQRLRMKIYSSALKHKKIDWDSLLPPAAPPHPYYARPLRFGPP